MENPEGLCVIIIHNIRVYPSKISSFLKIKILALRLNKKDKNVLLKVQLNVSVSNSLKEN